ncbi:hypothetical protein M409DRAFT_35399 [Zasmidium cellare ATCC 36951]|uniref:RNA helicase n=1 Tax=Zasmidium cellare ATCC 36951 TaxID=1080233 RepID=A0A6A6D0W2_ZASCE|nr:uncharacterized protein M409DRAFT_35399 [Zasmidium cellare ATCC 36951]KAF2173001.1 hypothetical protein M409DRAFT_35399 [Zasmidium cellare ATCC 36951]
MADAKPTSAEPKPAGKSWADDDDDTPINTTADAKKDTSEGSLAKAQADGATSWMNGSHGLDEPEFDVNVKLADLQEDPNNPLFSVKHFEDLNLKEELLQAISTMGFRKPSKIQERALPLLLKNPPQNFVGQSQSGTGKTAAFLLNILQRVNLDSLNPQAIVLAPTRELARQIANGCSVMGTMLQDKGLKVFQAVPDPSHRSTDAVEAQVVVGTPGTVMDLLRRKKLSARDVKILTIDEADNMLDLQGMGDQCRRIKNALSKDTQIVLFSATFPQQVLDFVAVFAPKANTITLQVEELTVKGIKQLYLDCQNDEEKYTSLVKFYNLMTIASSIIFVKERVTAAEIERRMTAEGHTVAQLTGALEGAERDAVFEKFRNGTAKVLIATNVLSRGIDVRTVTMVVNYDIPETVDGLPDFETYLHRIGRTGRFGRTGVALSFVHDRKSWQGLMAICKHFQVEPTRLDTADWEHVERMLKGVMHNSRNVVGEIEMD